MPPSPPLAGLENLAQLLGHTFEVDELRRVIEFDPKSGDLPQNLPCGDTSRAEFAHAVVKGLHARGALDDDFFSRLADHRPGRRKEFQVIRDQIAKQSSQGAAPPRGTSLLLERFIGGNAGRRRLEAALRAQTLVADDAGVAERLADTAQVGCFGPGDSLISEGDADTDIFLILVGSAVVEVHGRPVATRRAGQHVGEMALIDPTQCRSATIKAVEETIVARLSEEAFARLARTTPELWRRLAVELASRLRERGDLVHPRPERPLVFFASTKKQLDFARRFAAECSSEAWEVRVWADGATGAGMSPLDSFIAQRDAVDIAVIVGSVEEFAGILLQSGPERLPVLVGAALGRLGAGHTLLIRIGHTTETPPPGVRCFDVSADPHVFLKRAAAVAAEIHAYIQHSLAE